MTKYSLFLLVLSAVSCTWGPSREDAPAVCFTESNSQALFIVDKVQGRFVKSPDDSKEDNLPSKFTLEFKACVKDMIKKQPIRNGYFGIHTFHSEDRSLKHTKNKLCDNIEWGCIPAETNSDGCLEWTEPYNFALPAEQKWIDFKRVITHHTGTRVIPLMVNPWIPDTQIVDLSKDDRIKEHYLAGRKSFHLHDSHAEPEVKESELQICIEEGSLEQAFKYLDENEDKAFLWVDEIEISPSFKGKPEHFDDPDYDYKEAYQICENPSRHSSECDREGGFLNLNLKIPVQIISEDESGRIAPQPAHADEFAVTFYLLSQVTSVNGREDYMLHRPVSQIRKQLTISGSHNYIHLDNAWLHIPYETTEGTSTLLLKIEAIGGGNQMDPFYGIYDINDTSVSDFHHLSTELSLRSSEDKSVEVVDLEDPGVSNVESQKQRIKEYKSIFEEFDQSNSYAEQKPQIGKDGFDYSKGLALDLSRMRFARVKASGLQCESPVERTVVYLGEVCLKDPRTDEQFSNSVVTVTAQGMDISRDRSTDRIVVSMPDREEASVVENRRTDELGCVQFTYELSHKLYDVQKYFMKKLTFKVHGVEDYKYIALNPWEYGFLTYQEFTQAYENWEVSKRAYDRECGKNGACLKTAEKALSSAERNLMNPALLNSKRAENRYRNCLKNDCVQLERLEEDLKISESQLASPIFSENLNPPILRLNEYRNAIIEPSYRLEPSLDVQTVKNIQLLLQPTIVRQDSPGETIRQIPRILPIGYYLMRVIIAKGPQETAEGKELIIDRLDPVQSAVRLVTDLDWSSTFKNFGSVVDKITFPAKEVSADALSFNELDARAEEFEQSGADLEKLEEEFEQSVKALEDFKKRESISALEAEFEQAVSDLERFREEQSYNVYRQHSKSANAQWFFSDGCREGDRLPCFEKEDYITHFDTLAYVENGVLNAFVKLGFNVEHFRHLGSKNSILIEVYPTDPREYKYLNVSKNGSANRCRLDIENTSFKPFPECKSGEAHEGCHELKTPAHWGFFFNTEFGNVNIMWPIEKDRYSRAFGLDQQPLEVQGKNWYHFQNDIRRADFAERALNFSNHPVESGQKNQSLSESEKIRLSSMENSFNDVLKLHENSRDLEERVDRVYEDYFKNLVDSMDRVDSDEIIQYCRDMEERASRIESRDLNGDQNPLSEELSLSLFVCKDMSGFTSPLRGYTLRTQIRNYFIYRDLADAQLANKKPLEKYRQVQNQEGGFCDETLHTATSYKEGGSDFSKRLLSYQECACSPPHEESVTKKMARCFAQSQSLIFVEDNQKFLEQLKKSANRRSRDMDMNEGRLGQVVQQNGRMPKNFLQSMCSFWFDEYYKSYLDFDSIESSYNQLIPNLESLYSDSYLKIPEDNQFKDVVFEDFKNISENPSPAAQWFQAVYAKEGYEPFGDYRHSSSSLHPYYQCVKDPLKFFHIERKIMVDQLDIDSNQTEYKNGRVYSLITQAGQGAQARVELSKRQQTAVSGRGTARVETPKWVFADMFRASVEGSGGVETARTGTSSASEHNSNDSTKSILLAVNHVQMNVALKKHRSCLLIRPKTTAFEKTPNSEWVDEMQIDSFWSAGGGSLSEHLSEDAVFLMRVPYTHSGLFICFEESSESLVVPENYYYIHQFFGGHAYEFMSRTIYHNRPYTEIIRGREQMDRFIRLTRDVIYNEEGKEESPWQFQALINHLDRDRDRLDDNLVQAFEKYSLDWSGFYKGIYTYPDLMNYYDFETAESAGWIDKLLNFVGDRWAVPSENIHKP